jgi:hypothetical protein
MRAAIAFAGAATLCGSISVAAGAHQTRREPHHAFPRKVAPTFVVIINGRSHTIEQAMRMGVDDLIAVGGNTYIGFTSHRAADAYERKHLPAYLRAHRTRHLPRGVARISDWNPDPNEADFFYNYDGWDNWYSDCRYRLLPGWAAAPNLWSQRWGFCPSWMGWPSLAQNIASVWGPGWYNGTPYKACLYWGTGYQGLKVRIWTNAEVNLLASTSVDNGGLNQAQSIRLIPTNGAC